MNGRIAADVPEQVRAWAEQGPVVVEQADIQVERGTWEGFCAAVEDGNPLYWEEALARRMSQGVLAPPVMLSSWSRPHPWSPEQGGTPRQPLALHFMLKEALELPLAIVRDTELLFLEPLRGGERVRGEQYLREVSVLHDTHLGPGRNWMIEVHYQRNDGVALGMERIRCLGYRSAETLEGNQSEGKQE